MSSWLDRAPKGASSETVEDLLAEERAADMVVDLYRALHEAGLPDQQFRRYWGITATVGTATVHVVDPDPELAPVRGDEPPFALDADGDELTQSDVVLLVSKSAMSWGAPKRRVVNEHGEPDVIIASSVNDKTALFSDLLIAVVHDARDRA